PPLTSQVRIINPFDPAVRDRARLKRIFGFDYTNEMFVPAAKRRWGYYVYPLLEGDRFVGRIEAKGDRSSGLLRVTGFWTEGGVRWGQGRMRRLQLELDRFARLAGLTAAAFEA
ncbi:MAG: crosslink repair DNA glycosylase YcaQ family protein, partial [Pseudomonadota bacterium]|nr:crosslink repair DNA glycosylase YcaQ family protein [Pseudomonadota bacterium]